MVGRPGNEVKPKISQCMSNQVLLVVCMSTDAGQNSRGTRVMFVCSCGGLCYDVIHTQVTMFGGISRNECSLGDDVQQLVDYHMKCYCWGVFRGQRH